MWHAPIETTMHTLIIPSISQTRLGVTLGPVIIASVHSMWSRAQVRLFI